MTLIPGDGIGPEVSEATKAVLDATGVAFEWEEFPAGMTALESHGDVLPAETLDSIRRNGTGLKGPITTPIGAGFRSVNVGLRQALGLYANLRPGKTIKGVQAPFDNIDLVVVRENLEGMYSGVEFDTGTPEAATVIESINANNSKKVDGSAAISIKVITPEGVRRIVRFAFEYARANNRSKVTIVHKANIMKFTDGLFLEVSRQVAQQYPNIEFEDRIVDNMSMQLVQRPERFDVLVCPNLYGDILSDLCAGLVGGLGMTPSAGFGDACAVFETVHGTSPEHAGMNNVNPTAAILAAAWMLRHLGEGEAARQVDAAVTAVIEARQPVT
ncbi:MAG: isocitrate/isopropylmalate dehydrogenase family protein, partial [Thermomicrobiales bacterium]